MGAFDNVLEWECTFVLLVNMMIFDDPTVNDRFESWLFAKDGDHEMTTSGCKGTVVTLTKGPIRRECLCHSRRGDIRRHLSHAQSSTFTTL